MQAFSGHFFFLSFKFENIIIVWIILINIDSMSTLNEEKSFNNLSRYWIIIMYLFVYNFNTKTIHVFKDL